MGFDALCRVEAQEAGRGEGGRVHQTGVEVEPGWVKMEGLQMV